MTQAQPLPRQRGEQSDHNEETEKAQGLHKTLDAPTSTPRRGNAYNNVNTATRSLNISPCTYPKQPHKSARSGLRPPDHPQDRPARVPELKGAWTAPLRGGASATLAVVGSAATAGECGDRRERGNWVSSMRCLPRRCVGCIGCAVLRRGGPAYGA